MLCCSVVFCFPFFLPQELEQARLWFYLVTPFVTFCNMVMSGAVVSSLAGQRRVHILDFSQLMTPQWSTIIKLWAAQPGGLPHHVRLTLLDITSLSAPGRRDGRTLRDAQGFRDMIRASSEEHGFGYSFEVVSLEDGNLSNLFGMKRDLEEGLVVCSGLSLMFFPDDGRRDTMLKVIPFLFSPWELELPCSRHSILSLELE